MLALWEAKGAAKMPHGHKPPSVCKANCGPHKSSPGFLGRLRELAADGEPEPINLLCAMVRVKVAEQGIRPDTDRYKPSEGRYANGNTLCRDERWASNLQAARAWLERGAPPAVAPHQPSYTAMARSLDELCGTTR